MPYRLAGDYRILYRSQENESEILDLLPGTNVCTASRFPFSVLENVVMTPHIYGVARTTFDHRVQDLLFNVEALSAGRPLRNEVKLAAE
jgi:phosphoglycerate dehydrogenase-like enzyme